MKESLELRRKLKKKKPIFSRQDSHKKPKLSRLKWRKPKGSDSKMRRKLKGYRRSVSKGWRSPKKVRGLNRERLEKVMVKNLTDLEKIDTAKQIAVVSSGVGKKKLLDILGKAKEKKIRISNFDIDNKITNITKSIEEKKKSKEKKEKEKAAKKPAKKKDEGLDKKLSDEDKKEQEKKEKDKLLIKKGGSLK